MAFDLLVLLAAGIDKHFGDLGELLYGVSVCAVEFLRCELDAKLRQL